MKIRVTTESGSYYDIDITRRLFERNGDGLEVAIMEWRSGDIDESPIRDWPEVDWPVIGETMYIHGEGLANWYLTTKVTQINEIDEGLTMTSKIPVVKL